MDILPLPLRELNGTTFQSTGGHPANLLGRMGDCNQELALEVWGLCVPVTGDKASSRDGGKVILSDNAQEAPTSGPTRRKLMPDAIDTNVTPESLSLDGRGGKGWQALSRRPTAGTALFKEREPDRSRRPPLGAYCPFWRAIS